MPRAGRADERMRGRRINFPPTTWEALRTRAFHAKTTVGYQVRQAVEQFLARRQTRGGERVS